LSVSVALGTVRNPIMPMSWGHGMFGRKIWTALGEPVDSDDSRFATMTTLMPFSSRSLHAGALPSGWW
jgi:hypothetical protein